MPHIEPPQRLVRALSESVPDAAAWLEGLPGLVERAVAACGVSVERVQVPGGRSSLVVLVRLADGTPAVLKAAPERFRPAAELAALEHWGGLGAVQVLGGGDGVLLLERLRTDVSVRTLPEAKAALEAAGALRRLWVEPPEGFAFETVAERTGRQAEAMRSAGRGDAAVGSLVDAALGVREELVGSGAEVRLLHGTFRQSKVLAGERSPWLAVGPDPVVGECAFDLARLVRDRVEDLVGSPSGAAVARRRVKKLAEVLEVDQERLRGWVLFRAVESGVRAMRVGRTADAELLLEFAGWL
ncbi:aminoglycoside phosphotransferase family protein [Streptomyces niveiscabiei]|uniref:aminoglycoside phosphotransferase family protein n=1 Tax=Streptomyces niveiscabiei TaxID=164115 RepID=UPI0029BEC008|nr:aminoglycoside phosphotransferase family protein [Streptomyces niveiscabiei]MDX3386159.1 aminoglycoside phosphotransferase family protein [Streptomyces niveiscabiei]